MKKILFIHHAKSWGGAPLNMINIIKSLDKKEYYAEVLLLMYSEEIINNLNENNINYKVASSWFYRFFYKYYYHLETGFIKWYMIQSNLVRCTSWLLSNYYFASKELKRFDFDIVHLNSSVLTDWIIPAKKRGKVIIHIQESLSKGYFGIRLKIFKSLIKKTDKIIYISKDSLDRVKIKNNAEIIYNYSDIDFDFEELELRSYDTKKILYAGGVAKIKGFYTLINSLDYLDDNIKIYFLGYYPNYKNGIKKMIKRTLFFWRKDILKEALIKLDNSNNVIKIGMVKNINKYIDDSVCIISPFTLPHFSRLIIEAFGRRKTAIATNLDGIEEIIQNNYDGVILNKNDSKTLAKEINRLCNNPQKLKIMGDRAYMKAKKIYSQENIKKYEIMYGKLF